MPEEENKKLRDLVSETLQTKGVLGRVQAEIRASVFLALEEQDVFKDKSPFINRQLIDFLKSPDGVSVISLVREFLEFFNLEFTSMVFDPETQAGVHYDYEGRTKLANLLNINDQDKNQPLLLQLLKISKSCPKSKNDKDEPPSKVSSFNNSRTVEANETSNSRTVVTSEFIGPSPHIASKGVTDRTNPKNVTSEFLKPSLDVNPKEEKFSDKKIVTTVKETGAASLSSLSNLPPIGKTIQPDLKYKESSYDLKSLLDLSSEKLYDDFLPSENLKKENKVDNASEESEIEEEISEVSNITAPPDDNTTDISVSKASGHGDYLENL